MKCKCIKSDPMEWIEVGKTYDIRKVYNVYMAGWYVYLYGRWGTPSDYTHWRFAR